MPAFAAILLKMLGNRIAQRVIVAGLEEAAKRSDNTVDDVLVKVVREGLEGPAVRGKQ